MTTTRDEFIRGLRELADFLTVNPGAPTPAYTDIQISTHGSDAEQRAAVDEAAAAMGVEPTDPYGHGAHWQAQLHFGPIRYYVLAIDEAHMEDFREASRLVDEALAAQKRAAGAAHPWDAPDATAVVELLEDAAAPFVQATPEEIAAAYESSGRYAAEAREGAS